MIKAVFFDMNETLLSLDKLQDEFDKYFDDKYIMKYWFTKLLHTSTIIGSIGNYKNFGELAKVTLANVFYEANINLIDEKLNKILGTFKSLGPYDDVYNALKVLNDSNIRVIPVSNSSLEMMKEQLTNGGIINLVDRYYSVDFVEKYKPFSNIYEYVAKEEGLELNEIYMVATHDWDLYGAKQVGLKTAYIQRKRTKYNPLYKKANIYESNLEELVKLIISES